jgi:hypothetical protein
LLELFINLTHDILEDVVISSPEVSEKDSRHDQKPGHQTREVHQQVINRAEFIVDLKLYDLLNVHDEEGKWNNAVVYEELGKGLSKGANERETMAINNVAGDVEGHGKSA